MNKPSRWRRALEGAAFVVVASMPGVGWLLAGFVARETREPGEESNGQAQGQGVTAPRCRRLAAGAVDFLLAYLLCLLPYIGWLLGTAFVCLRDHRVLGGRSPGKRLARLRVVGAGGPERAGATLDMADHVRRNLLIAIPPLAVVLAPIETVLLACCGKRLGDRWAHTVVVLQERS
ncbi:MAG: hypothetical protein HY720_27020 [Planctomycetes bacterium]|nr:hypothetical protein [Planctomycetota bacterium]